MDRMLGWRPPFDFGFLGLAYFEACLVAAVYWEGRGRSGPVDWIGPIVSPAPRIG